MDIKPSISWSRKPEIETRMVRLEEMVQEIEARLCAIEEALKINEGTK